MFQSVLIKAFVTPGSQGGLLPEISYKPICIGLTLSFYYQQALCHICTFSLPFQSTLFSPIDFSPPSIFYPCSPYTLCGRLYGNSETDFTCDRMSLVQVSVTCFMIFLAAILVSMVLWYVHIILELKKSILTSQPLSY